MIKQESIGLRTRKVFPNKEMIEKFDYMIDFYLPKRKLPKEVDELGNFVRNQIAENKRQKELEEYLGCTFIGINPNEKDFSAYDRLGKIQTFIDS